MFTDSDIIYKYTREDALNDGVLVDVSEMAKEAGFKYPVALTREVESLLYPPKSNTHQSYKGRLWDVLWMCRVYSKAAQGSVILFPVKIGRKDHHLKAICHGGDNGEPVITIMFRNQD